MSNIKIKFTSFVMLVKDVEVSKKFYTQILQQKITLDHGRNVIFENGFAIWEADFAHNIIFSEKRDDKSLGRNNFEIYFENDEIEKIFLALKEKKIKLVHNIQTQPWGQKVFRFFDPDGHVVEIGEPMHVVIKRFHEEGMSVEEIHSKSFMPIEIINQVIKKK